MKSRRVPLMNTSGRDYPVPKSYASANKSLKAGRPAKETLKPYAVGAAITKTAGTAELEVQTETSNVKGKFINKSVTSRATIALIQPKRNNTKTKHPVERGRHKGNWRVPYVVNDHRKRNVNSDSKPRTSKVLESIAFEKEDRCGLRLAGARKRLRVRHQTSLRVGRAARRGGDS